MGREIMFGDILELWNSIKKKNMIFYFFYVRVDSNRNDKGREHKHSPWNFPLLRDYPQNSFPKLQNIYAVPMFIKQ